MNDISKMEKALMIDEETAQISLTGTKTSEKIGGLEVKRIYVSKSDSLKLSAPSGNYVTVNARRGKRFLIKTCVEQLKSLIKELSVKCDKILLVGIGNPYMITDSLGAKVVERLMDKRPQNLLLFTPFLEGITGISSYAVIKSLVEVVKPSLVIVVDALAARSSEKICTSFQFTDSGLTPGSALGAKLSLNYKTLKVPVIAVGTPTVVNCRSLDGKYSISLPDMLVCPKNIDELVDSAVKSISEIILKAVE